MIAAPAAFVAAADHSGRPVGVRVQGELPLAERLLLVVADLGLVAGLHPFGIEEFLQPPAEPAEPDRVQAGSSTTCPWPA